ncbi:alpha/beta hydrolase fold domain-containing protein [Amorphoplanes digitatis]|uniref:Acetyl esterase/lipase n=1 Tax=Actinoplanes digitatis TaxID=1868 RepID=A0A7W7HYE5_9ACTN|nr:alpha/beta hydrolase fold domain-containing protein [Actinoplanes digitatis]MBB4763075.1 acetyl esterase/lipase [Actinoplanes digitatis]
MTTSENSVIGMTKTTKKYRNLTIGLIATGAILAAGVGVANADDTERAATQPGWAGVTREQVRIDFGKGWVTKAELTYPSGAKGRLPLVIFLHGSGRNDMNQTLPEGKGTTFVPLAQAAGREGFATLRFNKRGVTDIGPVESTDPAQLMPKDPYHQIQQDAASVVRFAAKSPRVDPSKIFLLGHSEGTNVAANLAADSNRFGIPKPAGVVEMGVVGLPVKQLLTFQIYGRLLAQMHDEFDVDGDGQLTAVEATDGLLGQPKEVADQFGSVLLDGKKVLAGTDKNHDGQIAIDAEAGVVLREVTHIGDYPNLPGLDQGTINYLKDIARFPTVSQSLPKFSGPTLLLNGENDLQTPARAAIVADAALSGHRDHKIVIYPGMAHTMNITPKFHPEFGEPDKQVITEIQGWLKSHR